MSIEFKVGDFVRLRNGWTKMVVVRVLESHGKICASYIREDLPWESLVGFQTSWDHSRHSSQFILWDPADPNARVDRSIGMDKRRYTTKGTNSVKPTQLDLFQTAEQKPRYGKFIGKNSVGDVVLEMRGEQGQVETFPADEVTKVLPYTFKASCATLRYRVEHYTCTPGAVDVGDILVSPSGNVYYVNEINTEHNAPKKEFVGSKLMSTPLENR